LRAGRGGEPVAGRGAGGTGGRAGRGGAPGGGAARGDRAAICPSQGSRRRSQQGHRGPHDCVARIHGRAGSRAWIGRAISLVSRQTGGPAAKRNARVDLQSTRAFAAMRTVQVKGLISC
jgi:hypothetical protein